MHRLFAIALIVLLATGAIAADLGNRAPAKPTIHVTPAQPDPATIRQGGDTIADAVPLSVPGSSSGTTVGYGDDYDESCPWPVSGGLDVVYQLQPAADITVQVDTYGSNYDTKIYIYDQDLNLVDCNDDYHPDYTSRLSDVALVGGEPYYLIIDGYSGASGTYVVEITEEVPCVVECWGDSGVWHEDEVLGDGYLDSYNGGCNSPEFGNPFSEVDTNVHWALCGTSGWYTVDGNQLRDTDWYRLRFQSYGYLEVLVWAEEPSYIYELGPQDCGSVGVLQDVLVEPCVEATMLLEGEPGTEVWFWIGPSTFDGPPGEYDYRVQLLHAVATEEHSWSSVKRLFD